MRLFFSGSVSHTHTTQVVDLAAEHIMVHYKGWSDKWDEWIPRGSVRLAPCGLHSDGPFLTLKQQLAACVALEMSEAPEVSGDEQGVCSQSSSEWSPVIK